MQQFSTRRSYAYSCMLDCELISPPNRTVPTHDDILVPETLLKKRKGQEKAAAERQANIDAKKKVSFAVHLFAPCAT
jgi:hypothetical protein